MGTGKIIKVTRAKTQGHDEGIIEDTTTGMKYRFEEPENVYTFGEIVSYSPTSADVRPGGLVTLLRKRPRIEGMASRRY